MRRPASTDLVSSCLDLPALRGVLAWRNNTTGVWDPVRRVFRTFRGRKGVSDILGILWGGRAFACEVKSGTGRLTPSQKVFLADVNAQGGVGVVVRSLDELEAILARLRGS